MSALTNFLNLFKYNPEDDGASTFDINLALNENWDKIDNNLKNTNDSVEEILQQRTVEDETNNKKYDAKLKIINGKPVLEYEEVL